MTPCLPCVSIQNVSVCTFQTSPCVPAPRAHVETRVGVVPVHTGTFWMYPRGRLWIHTRVFSRFFSVPQHAQTHTNTHTKHTPRPPTTPRPQRHTHHQQHNTQRHTETDREGETEKDRDKTRQDKTETEKDETRQDKTREGEKRRDETREEKRREERREKMKEKTRRERRRKTRQEERRRKTREETRWRWERRQRKREKTRSRRDTRWKRRSKREDERENEERSRWKEVIFCDKCLRTLKPARWISPKCFEKKKITVGRIIPPFFLRKFKISPCFQLFTSGGRMVSLEPTFQRREDLCKHSVYTHFPEDRNCEIGQRTKITRAPCRRRNGGAVPRAENFGDLITGGDKCESRNNLRYAVVVQDLATQWIEAYPCKT